MSLPLESFLLKDGWDSRFFESFTVPYFENPPSIIHLPKHSWVEDHFKTEVESQKEMAVRALVAERVDTLCFPKKLASYEEALKTYLF